MANPPPMPVCHKIINYTGHYDIPRDTTDESREGKARREREEGEAAGEC